MDDPGRRTRNGAQVEAGISPPGVARTCRLPGGGAGESTDHSPSMSRIVQERDQLRLTLQMVLDALVYDGAGRSVTVQNTLRGYLATRVRMALGGKRKT